MEAGQSDQGARDLEAWTRNTEEVLTWLLEAEDHLVAVNSLGQKQLETVKTRFYNHEDFMLELKTYQSTVGEVLTEGRLLMTGQCTHDQKRDIKLQMKVLNEKWENVRQLAMTKQAELHKLVMRLQVDKMSNLKSWMLEAESKLSNISKSEKNRDNVESDLEKIEALLSEFDGQQSVVASLSDFILGDTMEDSSVTGGTLEDTLTSLGEQWVRLFTLSKERHELLIKLDALWRRFSELETSLSSWMIEAEAKLKTMEAVGDLNSNKLVQTEEIKDYVKAFDVHDKKLEHMSEVCTELQALLADSPELSSALEEKSEALRDRFGVLLELQEAKNVKISRFQSGETVTSDQEPGRASFRSRLDNFEALDVRILNWAEHLLERLEDGIDNLDIGDKQFLYEETEAEVRNQQVQIFENIQEGEALVRDLTNQASEDREVGLYLESEPEAVSLITGRVEAARGLGESINTALCNLKRNIEFQGGQSDELEDKCIKQQPQLSSSDIRQSETSDNLHTVDAATNMNHEQSKLESDLVKCKTFLSAPLLLMNRQKLEDLKVMISEHIHLFDEAFVPASFTDQEASEIVEKMKMTRTELKNRENEVESLIADLNSWTEELQGLSMWMKEVEVFLNSEDTALGDLEALEAQLRESDALQEDIRTLQPNFDLINRAGQSLIDKCDKDDAFVRELEEQLEVLTNDWNSTMKAAGDQNERLRTASEESSKVMELIQDINLFLDQIESELSSTESFPVTGAPQLSQTTFKFMQLREKTDQKSEDLNRLSAYDAGSASVLGNIETRILATQDRWSQVTGPVYRNYSIMKEASSDYGEFKTLVAQETDWLERLEKKLKRGSKCAADAEEISEELDDLENCLHNHSDDRLGRLKSLASALSHNEVRITPVTSEAESLSQKWEELEVSARQRIQSLETCILEAQQWECKILAVQDWLHERDLELSAHLEHELTADDILEEAQFMLREFEDKENLLAEMEGQVDTYREEGKEEAASRLEDQLTLIHTKFQVVSGKFELFQRPSDFDGRLGRVSRQLVDLQSNIYLTDIISHETETIEGQLHHTRCMYNALANIKPDVEATIKMGRKLVQRNAVVDPDSTTTNIDNLKELFNVLGTQVTEGRNNLEKALNVSETLMYLLKTILTWLEETEKAINERKEGEDLSNKVAEMKSMKNNVIELLSVKTEFISLCGDPSLLSGLKEELSIIETKWSKVKVLVESVCYGSSAEDSACLSFNSDNQENRNKSPLATDLSPDESARLKQFREVFQEISLWLEDIEELVEDEQVRTRLDNEIGTYKPKLDSLGVMAVEIADKYSSHKGDIIKEVKSLQQRWIYIVEQNDKSGNATEIFNEDEITTLPEEPNHCQLSNLKRSFPVDSFSVYKASDSNLESTNNYASKFHKSSSPTEDLQEIKEPKVPPKTLPKPQWYVDAMRAKTLSPEPVQQVVVTSSTLPTPKPLSPPSSASPSQSSPSKTKKPTCLDDELLESQLAKDHAEIDQMFSQPVDIKTKHHRRHDQSKDIKLFFDSCDALESKIRQTNARIDSVSSESDLGLRSDLIDMETRQVQTEVTSTLSRGETLIMMSQRRDPEPEETKVMEERLVNLRQSWARVVSGADQRKEETHQLKLELDSYLTLRDSLSSWLDGVKKDIVSANSSKKELSSIARQMEAKQSELTRINKIGNKLTAANAFKGQEPSLTNLNQRWENAKQECSVIFRKKSPNPKETKSNPTELFNKISRVREAISAVDKQLSLSVLSGQKYEKIGPQEETLERIKKAIETLKPNMKKLEKDLEMVTGSVAVENFEKLTSLGEKCREEWDNICKKYVGKREVFDDAKEQYNKLKSFENKINSWLDEKLNIVKSINHQDNIPETQARDVAELHREVLNWQRELRLYETLGKKISLESDSLQSSQILENIEEAGRRWHNIVNTLTNNMNQNVEHGGEMVNVNSVVQWSEDTLSLLTKQVNVSDVSQLDLLVQKLENAQNEAEKIGTSLGKFTSNVDDETLKKCKSKVDRILQMLPKRRGYLIDRQKKIVNILNAMTAFDNDIEGIKTRQENLSTLEDVTKFRDSIKASDEKMSILLNEFLLIEREVTGSGFNIASDVGAKLHSLKNNWYDVLTRAKDVSKAEHEASSLRPGLEVRQVPHQLGSPVESQYSLGSPSSVTSSTSQDIIASPTSTTKTTSPMSEDVATPGAESKKGFISNINQIVDWLQNLVLETDRGKVRVDKGEAIAQELENVRILLQQLEFKKKYIDSMLGSPSKLELESEVTVNQVNTLKVEWKNVHQKILSRKTQLMAMLEHSDNFNSKGQEVSEWLGKLERQLAGADVGRTREVLLSQIREVNHVLRELQKYSHHVTLFTQMCQRMVSIYSRDITDAVHQMAEELSGRYVGLTTSCAARAKTLQTSLENINTFDREMAEFLAWLRKMETDVERIEAESEPSLEKLRELQLEIRNRDRQFGYLASKASEADSRLGELGRRWSLLQNMILGIQDKWDRSEEESTERLDEWRRWVATRRKEIEAEVIGSNLIQLREQQRKCHDLRAEIHNQELLHFIQEGKAKKMEDVAELEAEWSRLVALTDKLASELGEAEAALHQADTDLTDLDARLCRVEARQSSFTQAAQPDELEVIFKELDSIEEGVLQSKLAKNMSQTALKKLIVIEQRLTSAKESAVALRDETVAIESDPASQTFLSAGVPSGWERGLTPEGVPFFYCHETETTYWDHPEFLTLLDTVSAMNAVKYSAYRMALKLRKVQQKLCLDLLDISAALVCFDSHGLTCDKDDLTLCVPEVVTILTSIYETLHQCEPEDISVPVCVDLALNWILNVYDSQRQGFIRVISFKLAVVLLSRGPLTEKYSVMFSLFAGDSETLDQRRLGLMLYDLMMVPRYLGEVAQFGGTNIEPGVRSCFALDSPGVSPRVSLTPDVWLGWVGEEPQCLVWLPVLHRLASAETATHDVRCRVCKVDPIIGFRYHCRKCFNLDICHACFFVGKTVKGCKPEHPMQEYCTSTNKTDNARHILQSLRNSFRSKSYFKKKKSKLGYLPLQTVQEGGSFESPVLSPDLSFESQEFVTSESLEDTGVVSASGDTDEHSLIAAYCKLLTNENSPSAASILSDVDQRLDNMKKEAVEQLLAQLREENARLESEYKQLEKGENSQNGEEKALRQARSRLEARMSIMEDHNRQLEAQLERLRQLVKSETGLTSKSVVAAHLSNGQPQEAPEPGQDRPSPPSLAPERLRVAQRAAHAQSDLSSDCEERRSYSSGSLNLSQHHTDTVQDDEK